MDLCAEMLLRELHASHAAEVCATRIQPELARRFTRLPVVGSRRTARNADILATRLWDYPRQVRRLVDAFDLFHVCDHSYGHLVHALPSERTGVYCYDLEAFRCLLDPKRESRPRWFRAVQRRVLDGLAKAAIVFYGTHDVGRRIAELGLIDPNRLVHATLGTAPEFAAEPAPDDRERTEAIGLGGRPYLLHVGVCTPRKRIDVLLDVVARTRQRRPDLRLVQVGGEWTPSQREQIDRLRLADAVVQVRGIERTTLAALYRRAALALQTSEAEGFGLPVIEALACGAAVIASDLAVLREVGGEAVTYCPVADIETWTEAVGHLLDDRAAAPASSTRLGRAKLFSWANHARVIVDAYRRLAK